MQKQLFFYFFGTLIVISSINCGGSEVIDKGNNNENGDKKEQVSQNGFKYIHHIQNDGPKPQVGEYAHYEVEIHAVYDSLSVSNYVEGDQKHSKILSADQLKGYTNPVTDVLGFMGIGDSMTIKQFPDKILELPSEFKDISYLDYRLKLIDIKSPEEHSNLQVEKFNARKAQLLEGRANMDGLIAAGKQVIEDYKANNLEDSFIETSSGLKYRIIEKGQGKALRNGNKVHMLNYGMLMDGTLFEDTFESGNIRSFQVAFTKEVPGWEEAIPNFKKGTKAFVIIPYQLAFGEEGNPPMIPPKSDILYYIELME